MQYLSQRLARKPARRRDGGPPDGAVADGQRARIFDAAEELIGERGCAGATIEAIVKAAGVSTVTFYECFEDKQACFLAAFDRAVEEGTAALLDAAPPQATWPERVATALRALPAEVDARPGRARLCLVEAPAGPPALSARYEATLGRAARALRAGRELETAPAGLPETLEEATAGGVAHLLRERLEHGGGEDRAGELYPQLVEIALTPYLGDA
jgi:AcrR family transcriptional regulator